MLVRAKYPKPKSGIQNATIHGVNVVERQGMAWPGFEIICRCEENGEVKEISKSVSTELRANSSLGVLLVDLGFDVEPETDFDLAEVIGLPVIITVAETSTGKGVYIAKLVRNRGTSQ